MARTEAREEAGCQLARHPPPPHCLVWVKPTAPPCWDLPLPVSMCLWPLKAPGRESRKPGMEIGHACGNGTGWAEPK